MNPNVRLKTETQEQFKSRRKAEVKGEKIRSKGFLIWNSQLQGTYIKPKVKQ